MRFAEFTTPRTLLALTSVATLGLAVAAFAPCQRSAAARPVAVKVARTPLTPMRGCAERARAYHAAVRPGHGASYQKVLDDQVPALSSCLPDGMNGALRLTLTVRPDGQVREAELTEHGVRVANDELQTCVMAVVSGLAFPAAPHPVMLSTHLIAPTAAVRR